MTDGLTLDDNYSAGLALSSQDSTNLRKAGKWARFIAIVHLVFLILAALGFLFMGLGSAVALGDFGVMLLPLLAVYMVALGCGIYLMYLTYSFGSKAMIAVDRGDARALTESLSALGRFCKIAGILVVVMLGFYGLAIVGTVATGALAGFGAG